MTPQEGNNTAGRPSRPPPRALPGLADAATLLDAVLASAHDHYCLLDRDKRFRFASASALAALGLSADALLGRTWREAGLPAGPMEPLDRQHDAVLATGEGVAAEIDFPTVDGPRRLVCRLDAVRDGRGDVVGILAAAQDVTERRRVEDALREREARLRVALAAGRMGTWRWDAATDALDWDDELCRLFGVSRAAPRAGRDLYALIHPDDRRRVETSFAAQLAAGDEASTEYRVLRPDGGLRRIASRCRALRDATGRLVGATGVCVERPARAGRGGAAGPAGDAERERRGLELILDNISEAITAVFVESGTTFRNRAWLAFHGYESFDQLPGWRLEEIAPAFEIEDGDGRRLPLPEVPLSRALRGESFADLQVRLRRPDSGRTWWGSYNGAALRDAAGRVAVALVSMRDVTAQREAQTALRESEARYRRAVTNAAVPIMLHAEDGEVLAVSAGLLEATGYRREQLARFEGWAALAYPDRADEVARRIARRFREDLPIDGAEVTVRTASGERRAWVWTAPPPERLPDGRKCFYAIASDVTARKTAEAELRGLVDERERLLLELNHRVKNNLQLVSSLLGIQAQRSGEPKVIELFEQAGQRIAAIAQVHGSLYRGDQVGTLEFSAYLRDLCDRLGASFLEDGGRRRAALRVEAEGARLDVDRAIPLGLIVNELVTNAFKHGLTRGGAEIAVRVRFRAIEGGWRLEVIDGDDGDDGDEGTVTVAPGLGMKLVEGFARQLQGRVSVGRARGGYRVSVDLPR